MRKNISRVFLLIAALLFTLVVAACDREALTVTFDSRGGSEVAPAQVYFNDQLPQPENPTKTGYTFEGWYLDENCTTENKYDFNNEDIVVKEAFTLYANWKINQYTLTYNFMGGAFADSEAPTSVKADYQSPLTEPSAPVRDGYVFDGWYKDQNYGEKFEFTTMPASNTTIYAKWNLDKYTVTYVSDSVEYGRVEVENGSAVKTFIDAPTKEGYRFAGWYLDTNYEVEFLTSTVIKAPISVYAKWVINQYTISFEENGGSNVEDITLNYLDAVSAPLNPTKEGYTFAGWYTDSEFTNSFAFAEYTSMKAENLKLYAKWTANNYKIDFEENGGSHVNDITAPYGNSVTAPVAPTKSGYLFGNWYTDVELTQVYTFTTMPLNGIKLYASWIANGYTITFEENGGSKVEDIKASYGSDVSEPSEPTREGYEFAGWYSDQSLTQAFTFTTMPLDGATLYAKWTANKYTITFNENGGSEVIDVTTDYQAEIYAPTVPTRSGYTFGGWYSDEALTQAFTFDKMPLNGATLYAKWTVNEYTITFVENEGTAVEDITANFGAAITLPTTTRDGYTFAGWFSDEALTQVFTSTSMTLDGATLYAKWTVNEYTITFNSNGGSNVTDIVADYNTAVSAPKEPTRTGYTFAGWFSNETLTEAYTFDKMPLNGATLYAKWNINSYTFTIDFNNGEAVVTETVEYNTSLAQFKPEDPVKVGTQFMGWVSAKGEFDFETATMPAADLKVTAVYENEISVTFEGYDALIGLAGDPLSKPNDPERDGYTFSGWYLDTDYNNEFNLTEFPEESINVYAKWTVKQYTIAFVENEGTTVEDITADYGSTITLPTPTRDGYTFAGWFSDEALTQTFTSTTMPLDGETLYAKWTVNEYTITFNSNGGSSVSDIKANFNTAITLPTTTRDGYTFAGWYSNETLTDAFTSTTMPVNGATLYAKWTVKQYTITFNSNGGSTVTDITADYKSTITLPTPKLDGYTFVGWYSDEALTQAFNLTTMPLEGATLYAKWTANKYTITFEENGGSTVTDITADYNSVVTAPQTPTRTGYEFAGWYSESALQVAYSFDKMPLNGTTLYAKWTANTYTVVFDVNKGTGSVDSLTYTYDVKDLLPSTGLSKDGYDFIGWSYAENETDPDFAKDVEHSNITTSGEITLYATWKLKEYVIKFEIDGKEVSDTVTISHGYNLSSATNIPNAEKTGYTLSWTDKVTGDTITLSTPIMKSMTLVASYVINSYNAQFIVDNKVVHQVNGNYDTVISFQDYVAKLKTDKLILKNYNDLLLYYLSQIMGGADLVSVITQMATYINQNLATLNSINETVTNANNEFLHGASVGAPDPQKLQGIISNQFSDYETLLDGYESHKLNGLYVPFMEGYVFTGWVLGPNTKYVDANGATLKTGDAFNDRIPAAETGTDAKIVATFKKLDAITKVDVTNNDGVTTISWAAVDTKYIAGKTKIFYDIYFENNGQKILLATTETNSYTFNVYGTYKLYIYARVQVVDKDKNVIREYISNEHTTSIDVDVEMEGLTDSFNETEGGLSYRKDGEKEMFIFYTGNEIVFNNDKLNFTITDPTGETVIKDSEYATASKNKIVIKDKVGTFYFTNGITYVDEAKTKLKVYTALVRPYVTQFGFDTNIANFVNNKTGVSEFQDPTSAIYKIGRFDAAELNVENENYAANAAIYGSLKYANNGFSFGKLIKTFNSKNIDYLKYGDYIKYEFYELKVNPKTNKLEIDLSKAIDKKDMGTYDKETDAWSFTAPVGKYGVVISVEPLYLAPKQVADGLVPSISLVFELDNSLNVYDHDQFKAVFSNFTVGSNNVVDGVIVRGISLHSNIKSKVTPDQLYSTTHSSNPALSHYANTSGSGYDDSPINLYMDYLYKNDQPHYSDGNIYSRVTRAEINEKYHINGNYFTIDGKDLPYASINSVGNLSGVNGYQIANNQLAIITYMVGGDGAGVSKAHLYVNDLKVVANTEKPSYSADGAESSLAVMNRNSGGYCGIQVANGSSLTTNNTIVTNATIGIASRYGIKHISGTNYEYTGTVLVINSTKVISCWANSIYAHYSPNVSIYNSYIKDSGGAAIHLEDGSSTPSKPCGTFMLIDDKTVIENYVSGTEGYFKANGMELIAMQIKGDVDNKLKDMVTALNSAPLYNDGEKVIPEYTCIHDYVDPITGLPSEKINLMFLMTTCNDNTVVGDHVGANCMGLSLPFTAVTSYRAALDQLGYNGQLGNQPGGMYNLGYLAGGFDASFAGIEEKIPYALSGLLETPNRDDDGDDGMFIFANDVPTRGGTIIGLGLKQK